jgi:uncharacterized protein
MGNEANRQVIDKLFDRISANDVSGAVGMLTDDCIWHVPGKPKSLALAGPKDKQAITELFKTIAQMMPSGLRIKSKDFICDGDRVAVQAESTGAVVNGRQYDNQYHFVMKIRDGKVAQVIEYCDTLNIKEVLIDP